MVCEEVLIGGAASSTRWRFVGRDFSIAAKMPDGIKG